MDMKQFKGDAKLENVITKRNLEHLLKKPERGPDACKVCQAFKLPLDGIVLDRLSCRCWVIPPLEIP